VQLLDAAVGEYGCGVDAGAAGGGDGEVFGGGGGVSQGNAGGGELGDALEVGHAVFEGDAYAEALEVAGHPGAQGGGAEVNLAAGFEGCHEEE